MHATTTAARRLRRATLALTLLAAGTTPALAQAVLKIGYTPAKDSHYWVGSTTFCDEIAKGTANRELTSLARHLETAREDERARLARDLHDELGALLTAAKLDVARLRPGLQQEAPALLPRVEHLVQTLNSGIALKRRIIEDLRPSSLDNLGLLPALEILCSEFAERLQVRLTTTLAPVALSPAADLTAFRLVQESLNNIAKHAQARTVTVTVAAQDGQAAITVGDDGVGFDPARLALGSHGLVGMRYRVQAEGGQLHIDTAPGAGTQVQALLPLMPR